MKRLFFLMPLLAFGTVAAQTMDHSTMQRSSSTANERLGTVSFPVSCAAASQVPFNRGVALLHDFWYDEAERQFKVLIENDPRCAMAHWGLAMSVFHEIWGRPNAENMKLGWDELSKARSVKGGTERERDYMTALAVFYQPGEPEYMKRIGAYTEAMRKLYAKYPGDVDAGAFYALSLLADASPTDTSLAQEHKAMDVLRPLFAKYPDNPGVDHYITHACDNPAMAAEGLAGADHYLQIAQDGPHAYHMPGHIYARLGLWPQDIASQRGSIEASQVAQAHGENGISDEPHSYDFLIYAYLQSGQDAQAKAALVSASEAVDSLAAMPDMTKSHMAGMIPYYRTKLPAFYALEMRDWKTAAAMEPVKGSSPENAVLVYWARSIADGHLHRAAEAKADLAEYDRLITEIRKGKNAYVAEGTGPTLTRDEMAGWAAFAAGGQPAALRAMRDAADLQDKVGQGEVDIPAREMLAEMLLEFGRPKEAMTEYAVALRLSPNRLNGLYGAGRAAEAAGEKEEARIYYAKLMKTTGGGADSSRGDLAHAKEYVEADPVATRQVSAFGAP